MGNDVLVVGSYVQDLSWRCERFPASGETVVGTFSLGAGGKGSNQAIAAARAGAATRFVGAVGADVFGQAAGAFHRTAGISSRCVVKRAHATGTAAILVDENGENQIVVALGANAALRPDDVPTPWVRNARVVVTQLESNLRTTREVLRRAKRSGATTILNPAPMRAEVGPLLPYVDILVPNETEFLALQRTIAGAAAERRAGQALQQMDTAALLRASRDLPVPSVIVTLAGRGCFVAADGRGTRVPGHRVRIVDSTGAGDAFVGALAAALAEGRDIPAAARLANAAAAISVTRHGTAAAMPHRREIRS